MPSLRNQSFQLISTFTGGSGVLYLHENTDGKGSFQTKLWMTSSAVAFFSRLSRQTWTQKEHAEMYGKLKGRKTSAEVEFDLGCDRMR